MTTNQRALEALDAAAWARLKEACDDPEHPYRNLVLGTVDRDGEPQTRYLVLRGVNSNQRTLELHTDVRSPKWTELSTQPKLSVLGYDPVDRLQLRLRGVANLYPPGAAQNAAAWDNLSPWTRTTYCGGPPGDALALPEPSLIHADAPSEAETEVGRERFGVIVFTASVLDWFQHRRGHVRRAIIRYGETDSQSEATWIAP